MKRKSREGKARYLQNLVKDKICETFNLSNKDIRTSTLGENGEDIKLLTLTAKRVFPYATECTNTEQHIGLYRKFKQNKNHRENLLVVKKNREQPLAVITLEHFFELLEKED
jgi:hypothetical protein|tara:strand:- start:2525 stop:2860 length:336 start_codon:yes stop_codon:yes gene_type:complete